MTARIDRTAGDALTLPERRIVIEAAAYLLPAVLEELTQLSDGAYYAAGSSVHDMACLALQGLGLLTPAGRRRSWFATVDESSVRDVVEARRHLARHHFEESLQAFVEHAVGYVRSLPDTRAAFAIPKDHQRIAAALTAGGYLARAGDGVLHWTDRIRPVMQEALLWDAEGACLAETYAAQEAAEARLFLARLPERLRQALTRTIRAEGAMAGLALLKRHWTGAGWSDLPGFRGESLADADFHLTVYMAVAEMVREDR